MGTLTTKKAAAKETTAKKRAASKLYPLHEPRPWLMEPRSVHLPA